MALQSKLTVYVAIAGVFALMGGIIFYASLDNVELEQVEIELESVELININTAGDQAKFEVIKTKALILNAKGDKASAIKVIENFSIKVYGSINDELLTILSTLYIETNQTLKAEEAINRIKNIENPKVIRIKGKVALMKGDNEQALVLLNKAFQKQPSQVVLLELVQALQNAAKFEQAILLMEQYLEENNS